MTTPLFSRLRCTLVSFTSDDGSATHCAETERTIEALIEAAKELTQMHHSCDLSSRMGMYCYLCALKEKVARLEALAEKENT